MDLHLIWPPDRIGLDGQALGALQDAPLPARSENPSPLVTLRLVSPRGRDRAWRSVRIWRHHRALAPWLMPNRVRLTRTALDALPAGEVREGLLRSMRQAYVQGGASTDHASWIGGLERLPAGNDAREFGVFWPRTLAEGFVSGNLRPHSPVPHQDPPARGCHRPDHGAVIWFVESARNGWVPCEPPPGWAGAFRTRRAVADEVTRGVAIRSHRDGPVTVRRAWIDEDGGVRSLVLVSVAVVAAEVRAAHQFSLGDPWNDDLSEIEARAWEEVGMTVESTRPRSSPLMVMTEEEAEVEVPASVARSLPPNPLTGRMGRRVEVRE